MLVFFLISIRLNSKKRRRGVQTSRNSVTRQLFFLSLETNRRVTFCWCRRIQSKWFLTRATARVISTCWKQNAKPSWFNATQFDFRRRVTEASRCRHGWRRAWLGHRRQTTNRLGGNLVSIKLAKSVRPAPCWIFFLVCHQTRKASIQCFCSPSEIAIKLKWVFLNQMLKIWAWPLNQGKKHFCYFQI